MATSAIKAPSASLAAAWATFATILAVGAAASMASGLVNALADPPAVAAARDGLLRLANGDPFLLAGEVRGLALLLGAWVGLPLAVLGAMLLIEICAGPRHREPKNYWLTWQVQALFFAFFALLEYGIAKVGPMPWRPLIQLGKGDGFVGMLLHTLPAYLLIIFMADFFRYWFHRAQHRFAILWRFHAVHHSPRDLDVLHNINHPVELIGNVLFIGLPMSLLVGMDGGQLYGLAILFAVQGHIHHMNVPMHYGPLRHLLVDNRFHFVHHSLDPEDFHTNFAGIFPVLDRLFGTYRAPREGPLPETGLAGEPPTRMTHYLLGGWTGREQARPMVSQP
ncbi:MAG TPA: sterol desaturase family protein [Allosphingosinicella sp.]|jgi:sterol desaturase/sphingolipid hydroxylase (fatty acid hydroxylase superfamily)